MGRFKTPAPAPPTTPYTRTPLRAQSKTPKASHRNGGGVSNINTLSLVAAFDDLVRNGNVFLEGSEDKCLVHVRAASDWRKRCKLAEAEQLRISNLLIEKDKELTGKDYQIRQARTFVEDEVNIDAKIYVILLIHVANILCGGIKQILHVNNFKY